jgi:DNA-binding IclR family transcriptional regulator
MQDRVDGSPRRVAVTMIDASEHCGATAGALVDPTALRAEIEATRRRGWGQVSEDLYLDVGGVAAVNPLHDDIYIGLGISYPLHRTTERQATAHGKLARSGIDRIASAVTPLLQPTS